MNIKIVLFIALIVCISSNKLYSQQKHALETWKYLLSNGKEPDIYLIRTQKQNNIKVTHELLKGGIWDEIFPNLVYVPGATYTIPVGNSGKPGIQVQEPKIRMSVVSCYMLNTEVTNKMYSFFLADSTDDKYKPHYNTDSSIADADLRNHVIAVKDRKQYTLSNYSDLQDYPVVGITYQAANAFCSWLSHKAIQSVDYKSDNRILFSFHLPLEVHYEVAAIMNMVDEDASEEDMNKILSKNLAGSKRKYVINYGQVIKADGSTERKFDDDGFYFTNPVKKFGAGKLGLYGMLGNAAEWMTDIYRPDRNIISSGNQSLMKTYNGNYPHVIKGGSWHDEPFYLNPYARQMYKEMQCSERIGFRICVWDYERN